ncbi:PAS domain-containing protein, partial [Patescibacteria group bacterium]|nr:PAS domain-containing protein [Patescibacteria group bacterium]
MIEGGDKVDYYRIIRLWLLSLNIAVMFGYGAIVFFTEWEIINYPGFRFALEFPIFYILFHFISNYFIEKKPEYIFELTLFLNSFYLLLVIDYFGGPTTYLALIFYIIILGVSLYRILWGIAYTLLFITYLTVYGFILKGDITNDPALYLIPIISAIISASAGYLINYKNQQIQNESESLKKVADKLTAEKSQDEAVLTSIADGVYAVDRDRNLVLLNKAAQQMVGWEEKDALGIKCKTVMKLIGSESDISVCEKDCPALAVWNTGEPVFRNDTCFMHRKTKNRVQLSSSYAPIKDLDGNMVGAICVFRDFTKEKELERQRNEFVSTASHELRTPITATEGYLSIITDSGMCKIDDNGKEYLNKARGTLMSMSALVKNLLAVTKIEEGKLEATVTNFPLKDLV